MGELEEEAILMESISLKENKETRSERDERLRSALSNNQRYLDMLLAEIEQTIQQVEERRDKLQEALDRKAELIDQLIEFSEEDEHESKL